MRERLCGGDWRSWEGGIQLVFRYYVLDRNVNMVSCLAGSQSTFGEVKGKKPLEEGKSGVLAPLTDGALNTHLAKPLFFALVIVLDY